MKRRWMFGVAVVVALTVFAWWAAPLLSSVPDPHPGVPVSDGPRGRSLELAHARRSGPGLLALDEFIAQQRALIEGEPEAAEHWRVLAEAHLERCLHRDTLKGMQIGKPTHDVLPEPNRADLDAGLAAITHARELGEASGELHRIEAGLLSSQIVSEWDAIRTSGRIQDALRSALELDPYNPRVLVAIACRKLFAPKWLGGDPDGAREMFLRAADALTVDERPLVFAAMAAYVGGQGDVARELLARALERNDHNVYARAVLRRLQRDEEQPFGRDVESVPR